MRNVMRNIKPPYRVRILSTEYEDFKSRMDSWIRQKNSFCLSSPSTLGIRLDDVTLRVIHYEEVRMKSHLNVVIVSVHSEVRLYEISVMYVVVFDL